MHIGQLKIPTHAKREDLIAESEGKNRQLKQTNR